MSDPGSGRRPSYSPELRTAVVLTGAGADGAYHAGVLRALQEAGVRVDLLAGHGIGVVGAMLACLDGGDRLWGGSSIWRSRGATGLYPWRLTLRVLGWAVAAGAVLLAAPAVVLAAGLVVYELGGLLDLAGAGTAARVAAAYASWVSIVFAPDAVPTWLPRGALTLLAAVVLFVAIAAMRANGRLPRRRHRGGIWWSILGAPMTTAEASAYVRHAMWDLLRGGAPLRQPDPIDLGRRAAELITENLGHPGFRELLCLVHDLDAQRDLVYALLVPEARRPFFLRKPLSGDRRSAEAFDMSGIARDQLMQVVTASLVLPLACDAEQVSFPPESYWQGETHRLCDRPGALARVLEEVACAGARQVIVVTAAPEATGPHALSTRRVSPRARLGDLLRATHAASVRDALLAARPWYDRAFVVRPLHNPVGPLDLNGAFDERSDRWQPLGELIERGYEDAYRQFIEPVVGASGEALEAERAVRSES